MMNFMAVHTMPHEERDKLARMFKIMDINGDGTVDRTELFHDFDNITRQIYT
jgi:Ca2+-binding EF-hand superfamily protein